MAKKPHSSGRGQRFLLSEHDDIKKYAEVLEEIIPSNLASELTSHYLILDTFDWRLFRKKLRLMATKTGQEWLLELYSSRDHTPPASLTIPTLPAFITELPDCTLTNRVRNIIAPRALLPVLEVQANRLSLVRRNAEDTVTATIHLDTTRVRTPKSQTWSRPDPWLEIVPVTGHVKSATHIARIIKQQPGTHASDADPIDLAVHTLNLVPMADSTWKPQSLNPSQAAAPAIAQGLLQFFEVMEHNEEGIIKRIDPEFLHDFRIAIRRTRTVLGQFKAVFPGKTEAFEECFSWLGKLTGPARDIDVLVLEIERLRGMRLKKLDDTLPPLIQFLQHKQDEPYKPLVDALQSQEYRRFKTNWRRFLERCVAHPEQTDNKASLISHVAPKKIRKLYADIFRQGVKIKSTSPASDYHQLRKASKKLRYLMEYFQNLYPKDDIRPLIKELKKLQDNLGEHQDLEVHFANLTTHGKEIQKQSDVSPGLLTTIEWICRKFEKRKLQLRKEFHTRFDEFSSKANKKRVKALFHRHV